MAPCRMHVVLSEGVDFNQQFKGTPLTKRKQASWPRRASPAVSLGALRSPPRLGSPAACRGRYLGRGATALTASRGELSPKWCLAVTR